jgi:hypothetical protein
MACRGRGTIREQFLKRSQRSITMCGSVEEKKNASAK